MRDETSIRPLDEEESINWAVELLLHPKTRISMGARIGDQLGSRNSLAFQMQKFPGAIQTAFSNDRRIGLVGVSDIDIHNKKANIWFTRDFATGDREGSMTDAVTLMCSLAATSLGLKTLFAWAAEPNRASHRLLERARFKKFGSEPLGFHDGQEFHDLVWFNRVLW